MINTRTAAKSSLGGGLEPDYTATRPSDRQGVGHDMVPVSARTSAFGPGSIAVVTVNWNGWTNTLACLQALRLDKSTNWHLYIVDNASTDDSLARLTGLGDDVTLVTSPINGGWTGGNNLGVRRALADGHEFVFLVNNDAFVTSSTLSILQGCFRQNEDRMPVLGPLHKDAQGEAYEFLGTFNDQNTGFPALNPIDNANELVASETFATSTIKGAGIFAHRLHYEKVGFFDERFFLNFDETDWCFRARAAGFPLLMVRDAVINHIGQASIGGYTTPLHNYFMTRNSLLFAEKHLSFSQRVALLRKHLYHARHLPEKGSTHRSFVHFLTVRAGVTAAFRRGLVDYFCRRFGDCPESIRRWTIAQLEGARRSSA